MSSFNELCKSILRYPILFENRMPVCTRENLGGPLWLNTDCVALIGRGIGQGGEREKGEVESS